MRATIQTNNKEERQIYCEKVIAREGIIVIPRIIDAFTPFLGKKIKTQNGFVAKLKTQLSEISKAFCIDGKRWFFRSDYSLIIEFDYWISFGERKDGISDGDYFRLSFFFGSLKDDMLESLRSIDDVNTWAKPYLEREFEIEAEKLKQTKALIQQAKAINDTLHHSMRFQLPFIN